MVEHQEAATSPPPILGLRLKTSSPRKRCHRQAVKKELAIDQARLMHSQDLNSYKCNDYVERNAEKQQRKRKKKQTQKQQQTRDQEQEDPNAMIIDDDSERMDEVHEVDDEDEVVDAVCREKMCEWSFRVCDHFHAPRDIVSISFSYLDRFLDRCTCDRTTFKLAAMTTLYMANKTCGNVIASHHHHHHHHNPLSIRTLANLSRGEFEMSHIAEMETILLSTLGWKVNPPTIQAMVDCILSIVNASTVESHHDMIYQRAIFFAELAVYDYTLVTKERALIALACILNAMEGMNLPIQNFCQQVQSNFGFFHYSEETLETCRNRLWYVYGNSAQYLDEERRMMFGNHQDDKTIPATTTGANRSNKNPAASSASTASSSASSKSRLTAAPRSPVSVTAADGE